MKVELFVVGKKERRRYSRYLAISCLRNFANIYGRVMSSTSKSS